jgi:small subunit ribosomal protein S3Ae
MAVGKNKRISKGGKKGQKKKISDPFSRKDWYDIKAPGMFKNRNVGKTPVSKTQGTKFSRDGLIGRVIEMNLAELQNNEENGHRKIKLKVVDVQGKACLTSFWGMDLTTDKLRSLVRKWQTLIEAHVDVKTTDGFLIRMFAIGFTKRRQNQLKRTCYAQTAQIRQIRAKMMDIMTREASTCDLRSLVVKFIPESIGKKIEKECNGIFPLQNVFIRKVKMLKAPKFDAQKMTELYGAGSLVEDTGAKVEREGEAAPQETATESS